MLSRLGSFYSQGPPYYSLILTKYPVLQILSEGDKCCSAAVLQGMEVLAGGNERC